MRQIVLALKQQIRWNPAVLCVEGQGIHRLRLCLQRSCMQASWSDLVVAYLVVGVFLIGLPAIFFVITFLPGLMRTTGERIGESRSQPVRPRRSRPMAAAPSKRATQPWPSRNFANTP